MGPSEILKPLLSDEFDGSLDFVTLGMFIIDDIEFVPPTPPVKDIIGGAGTYSALGARMLSPGKLASTVGWVVDMGHDFPDPMRAQIESWGTAVVMRFTPDRLTTRGFNGYDAFETRSFRYATPKKRLTADDLQGPLLWSRSFHFICSPTRCQELVEDIKHRRKAAATPERPYTRPIFIWEPVPDLCTPGELVNCTNTLRGIDICSPNHVELGAFLGEGGLDPETGEVSMAAVERWCEILLSSMPLRSFAMVIRAGEKGCYISQNGGRRHQSRKRRRGKATPQSRTLGEAIDIEALLEGLTQAKDEDNSEDLDEAEIDPGIDMWIPAYHQDGSRVVDPTGGGNTFLGGMAVALARGESIPEAATWGTVAASFAIEQVGVPELSISGRGQEETWNGGVVQERLNEFRARIKM